LSERARCQSAYSRIQALKRLNSGKSPDKMLSSVSLFLSMHELKSSKSSRQFSSRSALKVEGIKGQCFAK
jgi:hypothetical protein